ncbi:MAG: hypothetical protein OXM01_03355 [Gemmatimonadota bacterium]|nr:hypothetical protein [Gemmatimonadota bacterium]
MIADRDIVRAAAQQTLYQLGVGEDADARVAMAAAIADQVLADAGDDMKRAVRTAIAAAFSMSDNAGYGARRQASLSGRYDGAY